MDYISVLSDHPIPTTVSAGSQQQPTESVAVVNPPSIGGGAPMSPIPPQSNLPQAPPPYSEAVDGHTERLGSDASDAPPYSEVSLNSFPEQPAPILPAAAQGLDILPNASNTGRPTLTGAQLTGKIEAITYHIPTGKNTLHIEC